MIDRSISIHRPRIIRLRTALFRSRFQNIAPALSLLPRRQRNQLLLRGPRLG